MMLVPLSIVVIGLMVFPWRLQEHPHWEKVGWIPFVSPPIRLRDIVVNVLLFAPLGIGASLTWRRGVAAAGALAIALSLAGESAQLYSHSRFPSATDLVCNVSGALIAATITRRRSKPG